MIASSRLRLLQEFEAERAGPRKGVLALEGMDEGLTFGRPDLLDLGEGLGDVFRDDDLGAIALGGGDAKGIGRFRHHDFRLGAEEVGRQRHRDRVVAGRDTGETALRVPLPKASATFIAPRGLKLPPRWSISSLMTTSVEGSSFVKSSRPGQATVGVSIR